MVGTGMVSSSPIPMIAVTTSRKKIATIDAEAYSAAAAAGAMSMSADWMVALTALIRIRRDVGMICGMSAVTAGIWMPAPAERIASVR